MLGDFGVERPAVDEEFGFFGEKIRVCPDISDLAVVEAFRGLKDVSMNEAVQSTRLLAGALVHADDVELFVTTAAKNRQTVEDLITIGLKIIGALTARPTVLPSDSSGGQSTTPQSSAGTSSSAAVRLLEGRPDLQVAVLRAAG